jgi:hypothetical protein
MAPTAGFTAVAVTVCLAAGIAALVGAGVARLLAVVICCLGLVLRLEFG